VDDLRLANKSRSISSASSCSSLPFKTLVTISLRFA
jgi:hypothetical protein